MAAVLAGILACAAFLMADDFNEAYKAYESGDYKKAMKLFQKSCDAKDAWSCAILGTMYLNGKGVKQDYSKAAELFQKSCSGGSAFGCGNLAVCYEFGEGVKKISIKLLNITRKHAI
ncbi:MAG: sel1 repeat family protein [Campylobacteraceae bacterium]|jgi:TPR repeat protein|nr:sel1 repeat family protein [Campylobacteraceae bacterium]